MTTPGVARPNSRLIVCTEYPFLAQGLERELAEVEGAPVPETVGRVGEAAGDADVGLVVIQRDGGEALVSEVRDARGRFPQANCLVLCRDLDPDSGAALEEAGASVVLTYDHRLSEVVEVIRAFVLPERQGLASRVRRPSVARRTARVHPDLTAREVEVAATIARGLSNREIASMLGLQKATVKNHLHNILTKLGLSSRAALALYARRSGWVLPAIESRVHQD